MIVVLESSVCVEFGIFSHRLWRNGCFAVQWESQRLIPAKMLRFFINLMELFHILWENNDWMHTDSIKRIWEISVIQMARLKSCNRLIWHGFIILHYITLYRIPAKCHPVPLSVWQNPLINNWFIIVCCLMPENISLWAECEARTSPSLYSAMFVPSSSLLQFIHSTVLAMQGFTHYHDTAFVLGPGHLSPSVTRSVTFSIQQWRSQIVELILISSKYTCFFSGNFLCKFEGSVSFVRP